MIMNFFKKSYRYFISLFYYYPLHSFVRPFFFKFIKKIKKPNDKINYKVAFELTYDAYYFLFFGTLFYKLREKTNLNVDALVCNSISNSVGFNFKSFFQRSTFFVWLKSNQWLRAYGKDISIKVKFRSLNLFNFYSDLKYFFIAYKYWKIFILKKKKIHYKTIEIRDLVIETYLRFRPSPKFNPNDFFVLKIIWQSIKDIERLEKYFLLNRPNLFLVGNTSYITHGIPLRVALKHNIKTICPSSNVYKILSKKDNLQFKDCKHYKKIFSKLLNQNKLLNKSEKYLKLRFSGKKDDKIWNHKKSPYDYKNIKLNLKKSSVVIYLHDFFDAPHQYKNFIFDDYWDWLLSTIQILKRNKINFYIKQHPNKIYLNDNLINKLKKIIPKYHWLPEKISTKQLVEDKIIACGVTVHGTISHELAYFGIHSICCADHPHISFNFCRTAKSKKKYETFLINYQKYALSAIKLKKQSLAFYYMHNLYGSKSYRSYTKKNIELLSMSRANKHNIKSAKKIKHLINELYNDEYFDKLVYKLI